MASESSNSSAVLYPSPGMGHLVSMFELAKLLVARGLTVTILIVEPHYNTGSTAPFIARASTTNPSISFHRLPSVTPPPSPSPHHEAFALDLLRLSNPNLLSFLQSSPPAALIVDFFCNFALEVTNNLGIPTYVFMTSGASFLSAFLHLPALEDSNSTSYSFRELGTTSIHFPGVPPIPADHLPLPWLDRDDDAYKGFLHVSKLTHQAAGIIINTAHNIERRAVDTIEIAAAAAATGNVPPLYCIGPLINSESSSSSSSVRSSECLRWLDDQPKRSVVFLCFGSLGLFSAGQIKEIAVGLEGSGQRFLWVVRSPPTDPLKPRLTAPAEPDLENLLPAGFASRTKGRGMVVSTWAPQAEVLRHGAVGGFVTHCGWNSVLEALMGGVPMIGWPLYAEQRMNLVFLVVEAELAVGVEGYDGEVVKGEEVEKKVRWLMEEEGGKQLRERTLRMKQALEAALEVGGSSHSALEELVKVINMKGL